MTALRSAILCLLVFVNIDCTRKDSFMSLDGRWLFKVDSLDHGEREQWFAPDLDRSDWAAQDIPAYWDRYNLHGYVGVGWYFREFQIADTSRPLSLYFGGVDDLADVWVNGTKVGSHLEYRYAFSFDISRFVKPGTNTVVVRVDDESGPGGIYKPVEIVPTADVDGLLRTKYSREKARPSADWVKNGIIYEVYLRSFSPEGTIRGLEGRLDELKNLGVTILWLMPIHPVGALNRKGSLGSPYAVQDYYAINPEFGTLDDFKSLVRSVHDRGMRIIIDLVANHTSWDSELLMEHPDWFKKNEEGAIVAPNPDWTDVAQLDYNNHELRKYMVEMMKYWVRDIGIDGYRCDVAELVPTDFWEVARRELDKIRPVLMLAEGTIPEHHIEAFDLSYSWNLYAAMDKVVNGKTPARIFDELLMNEGYEFPAGSLRMRFNTNHDKNAWDNPAVVKFTRQGA
ncbi:MAG TPA: alpha-amylase family glycosyl hydrolase, partial [Bacteroidota bacterium]|nr:alpha-amylase family glycosyl hydrolase [Bacteroidota bacterium]